MQFIEALAELALRGEEYGKRLTQIEIGPDVADLIQRETVAPLSRIDLPNGFLQNMKRFTFRYQYNGKDRSILFIQPDGFGTQRIEFTYSVLPSWDHVHNFKSIFERNPEEGIGWAEGLGLI